jgi:hypothetical protein
MTTFQWRTLSPNTMRAYTRAAVDFEAVTGRPVDRADAGSIEAWRASMIGRRLSVSTIRQRLSAVAIISGVRVELPRRSKSQALLLDAGQVRAVMSVVSDSSDRILLAKLLTLGAKARTEWAAEGVAAHFIGEMEEQGLSAQRVSRKLRRYARRAGLDERAISLRIWCQSGRQLVRSLEMRELVDLLGGKPEPVTGVSWRLLHGIGRRTRV